MPIEGPNNQLLYLPYEAYEAIGRQLYGTDWQSPFSPGPLLPHPPAAKGMIEKNGEDAELIRSLGDPDSDDYKLRQIRSVRTIRVLNLLKETLHFGKATAFQKRAEYWEPVDCLEWDKPNSIFDQLIEQLRVHYHEAMPSPQNLGINQEPFDRWINNIPKAVVEKDIPLGERRRPGNPGFNWSEFRTELLRREQVEGLPEESQGFRGAICCHLYDWHLATCPDQKHPKPDTIRKNLKRDLDRIGKDYYGIE